MSPENDSPGEDTAFRRTIQEDSRDTYVIDAEALLRMTHAAEQLLLLDVSPLRAYRSAHIPGAVHVFWEDTVDREYPYFGAVVTQGNDQEQRIGFVRKLGLNENMHVVAYDNQMGYRAARLVWYLRFLGFSQVSLLDGGLSAWRIQGQSVQSGVNTIDETDTSVDPQDGYYVVTRQLLDRMATQSPLIVDTRTDEERSNDLDGVIPLGTIPGSVRFPWRSMIDSASAKLRNADQLLQELEQAGIGADRDVVVFGLFGVDTALPWLVLKHLGFPDVATYDRGWVEWASRPDLEKAPL